MLSINAPISTSSANEILTFCIHSKISVYIFNIGSSETLASSPAATILRICLLISLWVKFWVKGLNSSDNSYVTESKKKFRERCRQYFLNLPEEIAKKHIYSAMEENPGILQALMEIIDGSNIVDFGKIGDFLDPDYFLRGKNFLPLLTLNKSWYCTDDILIFENILDKIKNIFKMRAKLITEVSKFSHKIKKMWVCECGQKNRETQKYCSKCGNDIFGFKDDEIHPKEIQQSISQKIDILKEYFSVD